MNIAIQQLFDIENTRNEGVVLETDLGVGMARLGQSTQCIQFGTLKQLLVADFGAPLHCLALVGDLHPLEKQVKQY